MERKKNIFTDKLADDFQELYPDEAYMRVRPEKFRDTCLGLHKLLLSPVMTMFACDRRRQNNTFSVTCAFLSRADKKWIMVVTDVPAQSPAFVSLTKDIFSAHLFERQIREMFGLEPIGNPDIRALHLHEEVWPKGFYPLRKDFKPGNAASGPKDEYKFSRVQGEGVFEVPVGPVHAGIISPGHFRFSVAGEPIINLEIRLGFVHRGVEKLMEGKTIPDALALSECVSGDASFGHSLAFVQAAEKISGIIVPLRAQGLRAIFLELERMYNHAAGLGGMAMDVGFSFPAALAAVIKENILQLNKQLTASRYLKGVNIVGGVSRDIGESSASLLRERLKGIEKDFLRLRDILESSTSFMERVDTTGYLRRNTAYDLGVIGLAGRSSGIEIDLRKFFGDIYKPAGFNMAIGRSGDVLARLNVRLFEFEESLRLIRYFVGHLAAGACVATQKIVPGYGLGYAEAWRGPVLYWLDIAEDGTIERCKITDPSFRGWQGLSYAVLGDIIPDFPLCNKSFDFSYAGNDL